MSTATVTIAYPYNPSTGEAMAARAAHAAARVQEIDTWFAQVYDHARDEDEAASPSTPCPARNRGEAVLALELCGWADPEAGADLHPWP